MIVKQGKTNWKYILIVFLLAVLVGGGALGYRWWVKKQVEGEVELKIPGGEETCSAEHPEYCNRNCETDDDCVFGCAFGCHNKNQKVIPPEDPRVLCGVFCCQCIDNKCQVINCLTGEQENI